MGTAQFAVPAMQRLIDTYGEIVGIVTQPDRPKGRGKKVMPPPVKELAQSMDIPVFQPLKIKDPEAIEYIASWQPDLIITAAYGQIIPPPLLKLPHAGCINIHASLLPKYRGAAPIQRCLMNGENKTGITTMYMDEGLDTGDILLQQEVTIHEDTTYGELHDLLAAAGADLIIDTIEQLKEGTLKRIKQNDQEATYAEMIKKSDEIINWQDQAASIINQIRALDPQPGASTILGEQNLKIFKGKITQESVTGQPGEIIGFSPVGFIVKTGNLGIEILELQKPGKKRINTVEFLKGHHLKTGTILGKQV
ncbi:MAG: methionyl-tRNA formyltransferase [Syntrophomonadaceae bacterium]|jgi:methionyl-tRNA formyltransferase|nr:methionyl-tRNA formyltransferase [Syntrophomonadaceae bacterium]